MSIGKPGSKIPNGNRRSAQFPDQLDNFLREKGIRKKIFDNKKKLTRALTANLKPWEQEYLHQHLSKGESEFLQPPDLSYDLPSNPSQRGNGSSGPPVHQNQQLQTFKDNEEFPEMVGRVFANIVGSDPLTVVLGGAIAVGILIFFAIMMATI